MSKININDLTPSQKEKLMKELEKLQKQKLADERAKKQEYKELVYDTVEENFPLVLEMNDFLSKAKQRIYENFVVVIDLKKDVYGVKEESKKSHTFINKSSDKRIILGYHQNDNYDDTVTAGIEKVKGFISSLGKDKDSKLLVDAVLKLLSKDQAGNLKASRVLQLRQMADKTGDKLFLEGVKIIEEAYNPILSKQYIRAQYKDATTNEWKNIPLSVTEV